MISRLLLCLLCWAILLPATWSKDHGFDVAFEAEVKELFFENGQVSPLKIAAYTQRLAQKRSELAGIIRNQEIAEEGRSLPEARLEAEEHKFIEALDAAIAAAPGLAQSRSTGAFMLAAKELLDIEAAIRIQGNPSTFPEMIGEVRNYLRRWTIRKNAPADAQASNLFHQGQFLSVEDLRKYQARGGDISLLSPGPGSTFWQSQVDISRVDVKDAARGKTLAIYEGAKPQFPEEDVYWYEEMKLSDTKPKMDVHARDADGKKIKFKLKFGAEINADPTVAALLMTLGYPADMTKHVRNIRVILGKTTTLSDVKREWESYYRRDNARKLYKIEKYIKEAGTDSEGNNFIVFKDGLLEAKPKKLTRLGGWSFAQNSHASLREVRALALVNMWMDNTDIKQFENNRLILNSDKDAAVKRAHIISDVGHSLGGIFLEMPELFKSKMVAGSSKNALTINYRSFHPNAIKHKLTFEDARWATRLIATLTREQISQAVKLGKWPTCMARIYTEKLIARRNDLVTALRLEGSPSSNGAPIKLLPVDLRSTTINFDLVCDEEELAREHTSNYDFDLDFLLRPVAKTALRALLDTARGTLNDTRHITLNHAEAGFDASIIAQVILNVSRTYEKNPFPTSEEDLFIFQDHMEVGLRLGGSYGAFKDAVYSRHFTLSYPARSVEEARLKDGFIANIFLPLDVAHGKLPKKYVLKTEHHFESGAGVELDNMGSLVSPTLRARGARILLLRSFLDHRDEGQYLIYRDRAKYDEASLKLFARIGFLKLPLMETLKQWGSSTGVGSRFKAAEALDPTTSIDIQKALLEGDFQGLKEVESKFRLRSNFRQTGSGWDLVFWRGHRENRLERIRVFDAEENQRRDGLQYRARRDRSWSFLGTKERREFLVEVFSAPNVRDTTMHLNVVVRGLDTNTTDKEMENNYLFFVNGLSSNSVPLIPLTISLGYTTNGKWGPTALQTRTTYYHQGLERILAMTRAQFGQALTETRRFMPGSLSDGRTLDAKANLVWKYVLRARRQKTIEGKLKSLAAIFNKAVYRRQGFYEPRLLGALNRIAGVENLYSTSEIGAPEFEEQNLLNEAPFYGQQGTERPRYYDYLVYAPLTPTDLYFMFDYWR